MSSWDTNPRYPGTSEISTPPEIAVRTHFHARTWLQNYPSIFTCWWRSLLVTTSKFSLSLSGGALQPENTCSSILKVTGQVWESQKRISINSNHSYHQCSPPEASLNWSKLIFRGFLIFLLHNISLQKSFLNALVIFLAIYQSQIKHSRLVLQKNFF